ncbi:MAG: hypothetical protein ABSE39_10665 [Candidatus Bathyarchaeia archaeon]|jgi:hypothetical protein
MKNQIAIFFVILAASFVVIPVAGHQTCPGKKMERTGSCNVPGYANAALINAPGVDSVLVGGQNGTWFVPGQSPRLYAVYLQNDSAVHLSPVRSEGTVWGGGFNGSQFLISGWGTDDASEGPYISLYDGANVVAERSLDYYGEASSWSGGDVFAASYNGKEWLLSGLGSGPPPSYSANAKNHMSLGTFNGTVFTDLSNLVPNQHDAILYANAWNGLYWLIGGGYLGYGRIFAFDGSRLVDLTTQAKQAIPSFASVQSIEWNGKYWLIGGIGFVAQYNGHNFVDLTQQLKTAVRTEKFYSVNAIAWNGQSWMIGGGTPVAQVTPSQAWIATYTSAGFVDLSPALPLYISKATQTSSILTITAASESWIIGGYSGNQGTLFVYNGAYLTDYSSLVSDMTYVNWASSLQDLVF